MRILLIEDHPIVRMACRRMLQVRRDVEVAEAITAAAGLTLADSFSPDVIILDLRLPDGSGLDLLERLMSAEPDRRVIVFTMYEDPVFASRALEAGARGYITKNDDPEVLLQAIDKVCSDGIFLTPAMAEKLALMSRGLDSDPLRDLSPRERQVLGLLGLGKTLTEIAEELGISYRTSAYTAAQIKVKLQIPSTAALIKWAVDYSQRLQGGD
jgi:two-component system, NarL family, invasion response regulator UvrY